MDWQEAKGEGTPQGGVISPLLANIYLDPLDWLMAGLGVEMVRYADDMVVMCRSQEEAESALEKLGEWMEQAGLTLHPDKTRTVDMSHADSHFDFLGYRFKRSRRGRLMRLVRTKSLRKLRESIKPRTRRNSGESMETIVADINRTLKGWFGYFKHVHHSELEEIDRWMRVRLRSILRKRRGARAVAGDRITIAGQTATSPDLGSSACWMPKSRKSPVSDKEQTTNWRAVCGRSACTVRRGERGKSMPRSYLYPAGGIPWWAGFPPYKTRMGKSG